MRSSRGGSPRPALVREGGYQPETAHEATNGLLALERAADDDFAANDGMALAVMAAATAPGATTRAISR